MRNANAIDTSTRTLNVEVDIDNSRNLLRPGAYVFVHFHLPPNHSAVVIPANGLLFRKDGLRAALVKGDRVQMMPVTIGHDFGNTVEITSGLGPTDEVILDPPDSLTDGAPVRAQLKGGQQ